MADISLVIKSDTMQAEKDFQSFAGSTEKLKKEIEDFQKSFKPEAIDEFIAKNKLAALGISQTQGPLKGLTAETKGYEKEIKSLISSGLSPQSAEIQKLQSQYAATSGKLETLKEQTKKAHDATRQHSSAFSDGIKSIMSYAAAYISLRGVIGIVKSLTVELAEQGDQIATASKLVGLSAEAYQELAYAAKLSNVSQDEFTSSMEKFTKTIGEARTGSGSLVTYLNKVNPALLQNIKTAKSSEAAFSLLANEMSALNDPADKAALATAAFGRAGMGMITMLESGSPEIAKMREEARSLGFVMSNDAAKAAQKFSDEQDRLSFVIKGLIVQIGTPLLVPITNAIKGFTDWAAKGTNLTDALKTIGTVIAVAGAGIITYLAITKGAIVITKLFTVVTAAFNAVMSMNPIALIVIAVAALVYGIIKLIENWDLVKYKVIDFALVATIKMYEFANTIKNAVIGALVKLYEALSKLSVNDKYYKAMADNYRNLIGDSKEFVNALERERVANKANYEASEAKRKKDIESENSKADATKNANNIIGKSYEDLNIKITDYLNRIAMTEQMLTQQKINDTVSFFEQRAALESEDFDKRIEYLQTQYAAIDALEKVSYENRKAMEVGLSKAIETERKKQLQSRLQNAQSLLSTTGNMISDLSATLANFGKQSRELAVAGKAVAVAQAIINTYLGVTAALRNPWPLNMIASAITLAAGLAAVARIVTTPIPSGQTGLDYVVPDIPNNKNDRHAVNASAGERVTVTPRGGDMDKMTTIDIRIEEDNIFSVIQRGFDTGKLTFSDKNIRGGVFA